MKKVKKAFVRFFAPGSFVAEEWEKEIDIADPNGIEWPENAYAFTLHEREDVIDGETTYTGPVHRIGPMYYHPDSKVETLDEARRNPNASDILIRNMEGNHWDSIIWSRCGNWPQPFDADKAVVLSA